MKRIWIIALAMAFLCGCANGQPIVTQPTEATTTAAPTTQAPTTTVPETTAPPTTAAPVGPTLLSFLKTAALPVGSTMYIWGGGWNEADDGAGVEAVTLGRSPAWAAFAEKQTGDYDYNQTRYQIHDGLDCSGFVGWAVYNALETENGRPGYVMSATKMAKAFADMGLGTYIPAEDMTAWQAGDILSMQGHVWIAVGQCPDGSVLLLHASPPGVMFSGTLLPDGGESEASRLAAHLMQIHFPEWYARFPDCARPHSYLTASSAMRWHEGVLADPEGIAQKTAEEVAEMLFS